MKTEHMITVTLSLTLEGCRTCEGRGHLGKPQSIYPEPEVGNFVDPVIRYVRLACPNCDGRGWQLLKGVS